MENNLDYVFLSSFAVLDIKSTFPSILGIPQLIYIVAQGFTPSCHIYRKGNIKDHSLYPQGEKN